MDADSFDKQADKLLPGSWRSSWHWARDRWGNLTADGIQKAIEDLESEQTRSEKRAQQIAELLLEAREMLVRYREYESE